MVTAIVTTDGRIARRERNQGTVLNAVVELFESGNSDPAVEDVSEWSGVSTRSIYRYFHHRDGLIDAALWHLVDQVDREVPLRVGDGSLDDRIARFVEHRLDVYERLAPLTRAARRPGDVRGDVAADSSRVEAADQADPVTDGADRSVFTESATTCFAAEFGLLPSEMRRQAEVATEMAMQFEALEFLSRSFAGDRASVAAVLVRHVGQQLPSAAAANPSAPT
jgi:AcrR family transcriptional regulator